MSELRKKIEEVTYVLRSSGAVGEGIVRVVNRCEARIAALEAEVAELRHAVGLMTTLKPTMVMDPKNPLAMMQEVMEVVLAKDATIERLHRFIKESIGSANYKSLGFPALKEENDVRK